MDFAVVLGWLVVAVVGLGIGFMGGALVLHLRNRKQLVRSTKYLLDRLQVLETDLRSMVEERVVLSEYLRRKGLLDDEDLVALRRELIDLPRQLQAEKDELLKETMEGEEADRVVKDVPDTYH